MILLLRTTSRACASNIGVTVVGQNVHSATVTPKIDVGDKKSMELCDLNLGVTWTPISTPLLLTFLPCPPGDCKGHAVPSSQKPSNWVGNSICLICPARMVSFAHEKVYWVTEDDTCHMSEGTSEGHEESTK